jgi:hypothetical protein
LSVEGLIYGMVIDITSPLRSNPLNALYGLLATVVRENSNCDNRKGNEWAKVEISADGKLRSRTSRRKQKSPKHMLRPKGHFVAAIRPLLRNQMPRFWLP